MQGELRGRAYQGSSRSCDNCGAVVFGAFEEADARVNYRNSTEALQQAANDSGPPRVPASVQQLDPAGVEPIQAPDDL